MILYICTGLETEDGPEFHRRIISEKQVKI